MPLTVLPYNLNKRLLGRACMARPMLGALCTSAGAAVCTAGCTGSHRPVLSAHSGGGCQTHCLGLQNALNGERYEVPLSGTTALPTLQHVEIWFEENPNRCQIQAEIEKEKEGEEKRSDAPRSTTTTVFGLITLPLFLSCLLQVFP